MGTFVAKIPVDDPEAMDAFQEAMDDYHDELNHYIALLATKLGVSENCAANIWYLRSCSRWTQEKENELIQLDKDGKPQPNMNEF